MNWKAYNDGDIRTVTRFAWLPVKLDDQYVWWEKYTIQEKYIMNKIGGMMWVKHYPKPEIDLQNPPRRAR